MIPFTHFNSPGVAKRYELLNGEAVKKPAKTFKIGPYKTVEVNSMSALADYIERLKPGDFLTAGINETQPRGECGTGLSDVHRTKDSFTFAFRAPGVLVIDSDGLQNLGVSDLTEYEEAIERLIGKADYCTSPSASSGISVDGVGGILKGIHTFCFVEDADLIPQTLEILHKRSINLGYGYPFITKAGVVLIRSLVDTAMKTSNQPCFEGGALLAEGITQDRKVYYTQAGDAPSFLKVEPLTQEEEVEVETKIKELAASVADEAARARTAYRAVRESRLVAKGVTPQKAKQIIDAALTRDRPVLSGDFEIHTDKYGILTVSQLLADPSKYHEATCRDPLDPDDGAGKAKIYINNSKSPALNSFAHGGCTFLLEEDLYRDLTDEDIELAKNVTTPENILGVVDRTDSGNVAVLYKTTEGDLRYIPELKSFMVWHSGRWVMDPSGVHAHEKALGVANYYSEQAKKVLTSSLEPHLSDTEAKRLEMVAKSIEKWASQCRNKPRLDAMLGLAQRDRRFVVEASKLDQDPYLLGVQNGVIDLRTGHLQADSRSLFVTKRCTVAFNPKAVAVRWPLFISEITSHEARIVNGALARTERPHLARYLQTVLGYGLTGLVVEQLLMIMWGLGSNGKNVLLDIIVQVMGDYAETVSPEILMATKFENGADQATPSVRKLAGARLAISSESKEGQKLEASIVKRHTGGGFITARGLHQSPMTFQITHKLILMTNTAPPVDHMDDALKGRINMIPFNMRWNRPGEIDPDPNLPDAQKNLMEVLGDELEGILSWLVQGAVTYLAEGLQSPTEVTSSTRSYLDSQDSLKQWLFTCEKCLPVDGGLARTLYELYSEFCRDEGLVDNVLSPAGLGKKLKAQGYENKKNRNGMMYGLRIKETKNPEAREAPLSSDVADDVDLLVDRMRKVEKDAARV